MPLAVYKHTGAFFPAARALLALAGCFSLSLFLTLLSQAGHTKISLCKSNLTASFFFLSLLSMTKEQFLGVRPTVWSIFPLPLRLMGFEDEAQLDGLHICVCSGWATAPRSQGWEQGEAAS